MKKLLTIFVFIGFAGCSNRTALKAPGSSCRQPAAGAACSRVFEGVPDKLARILRKNDIAPLPSKISGTPETDFVLSGLEPDRSYVIETYRLGPAGGVLRGGFQTKTDAKGVTSLGAVGRDGTLKKMLLESWMKDPAANGEVGQTPVAKIRRILDRNTELLETHGAYLFLKTLKETPQKDIQDPVVQETASAVKELDPNTYPDHILIVARDKETGNVRRFHASPPMLPKSARRIDLNTQAGKVHGKDFPLDGFALVPDGPGPFPTVVLWGGSGGSIPYGWAHFLSSQGIAVVSIRYFSYNAADPAVARDAINHLIHRVPLERFAAGVEWAKTQSFTDPRKIFVMGESRGGEGALFFTQHFGNELGVAGAIALRPLQYSVGAKINGRAFTDSKDAAAWTLDGKDIPFLAIPDGQTQLSLSLGLLRKSGKLKELEQDGVKVPFGSVRPGFEELLKNPGRVPAVDVRSFNGKILSIGGTDDQLWPATRAVTAIRNQRPGRRDDRYLILEEAGHYTSPQRASVNMAGEPYFMMRQPTGTLAEAVANNEAIFAVDGGHPVPNAISDLVQSRAVVDFVLREPGR